MFQHTAARRRLRAFQCTNLDFKGFQHTAARRRLRAFQCTNLDFKGFQHTAARRRLPGINRVPLRRALFQHTAARRRLPSCKSTGGVPFPFQHTAARRRLRSGLLSKTESPCFNTQPPEGGCGRCQRRFQGCVVSTHSRPKAAAAMRGVRGRRVRFQHTAARRRLHEDVDNRCQV